MKKFCLFAILFSCIGTTGISQTVDVSKLSDYEKQMHRIGYCKQLDTFALKGDIQGLKRKKVFAVCSLLRTNNFMEGDKNRIFYKIQNDLKKQMILEEISFTQTDVDMCENDLKAILKDEYIPNFSYMDK